MAKIFHGGIKMKEKKMRSSLKKLDMEKKIPKGWIGQKERESPPRLNMWSLYRSVPEYILVILNTWCSFNG